MIRATLLLCMLLQMSAALLAQSGITPADLVDQQTVFPQTSLFSVADDRDISVPDQLKTYEVLTMSTGALTTVLETETPTMLLELPTADGGSLALQLVQVYLPEDIGYVRTEPSGTIVKVNPGKHYRGVIKGDAGSTAAVSIYDGEVMGLMTSAQAGNLVLGKLKGQQEHIIYPDAELQSLFDLECAAEDGSIQYSHEDIKGTAHDERDLSDCVRLYFEIDYDIFLDKGGVTETTNFVTGLYNQVATMYSNESINTSISPLVIWTETSPYSSGSSLGMLNAFTDYRQGFDGDLAMLLSYQASGGIAYVDGLCSSNPDFSMSFSSIDVTYNTVPTYSWSVMVVTHEFGHLLGSQHTHACAWNGNNTAIDGCYTTEGSCSQPGIPSGGGTVMSYCHLTSAGINLNNGFGPQPGNVIRGRVTASNCTAACSDGGGPTCTDGVQNGGETGVDCGGPTCPACPTSCEQNEATLTLVLDNYPGETTWTVTNAGGNVLYSGGPYSTAGATVAIDMCLADGCYDFNISDSYGDGICCGYGQGSYSISTSAGEVASGGAFGSSETTNFCAGGGSTATCTDGIENGAETGVDCGGPTCPACPSCTDGVQNGSETDVDCGGPDCAACPTCTDGVQNGSETGIDCGGPDCDECSTGQGGEVFAHYFESGWDGWQDGGSDCYRYSGGASFEGNYSIRLRDNSGTVSAMTSSSYDLSAYSGVEVNFYFYPSSMEFGEDFWLRYFDGNSWQTVAAFASGSSFTNGNFYVATVPILSSEYAMSSNAKFRFQCDASSNADRIFVDAITVTGLGSGSLVDGEVKVRQISSLPSQPIVEAELALTPNPASEMVYLQYSTDAGYSTTVEIIDLVGRTVQVETIAFAAGDNTVTVDIQDLVTGTYIVKTYDEEGEPMTQKLIKIR